TAGLRQDGRVSGDPPEKHGSCSPIVGKYRRVSEHRKVDAAVHDDETRNPPARRIVLPLGKGFFYSFNA
ncbi:MAG: hypothetical protein WAR01_01455, partial [Dokdonella sp.]|uniref:hypothetical protein n=1 Tax=Dokdonella sp. TaxID=2291710 RepID=UPI003BAFDCFC